MLSSIFISPLGPICLASDGEAITGLWFEERLCGAASLNNQADRSSNPIRDRADTANANSKFQKRCPIFVETEQWLAAYFSGNCPAFCPPVRTQGTAFCEQIWRLLREIPYGETRSYGDIAREAAKRTGRNVSPRAVGHAAGRNPVLLLIPCHRVIGVGGQLTGYAAGLERKRELLQLEQKNRPFVTR